ncbi:hypothetical protein AB4Z40_18090 [Bosea sp. 2YAB26]|jgi:hypothetical protein|uniref:hypothetical protein n=2 Tax=Pseudomonadota TaxID=1224 RepID=UPI003F91BE6A
MRKATLSLGLLAAFAAGNAAAMPLPAPGETGLPLTLAQMRCNEFRCINPRSGVYTESTCDYRGCYPSSRPRGRLGPYGEDYRFGRRRLDDDDDYPRYRGYRRYREDDDDDD